MNTRRHTLVLLLALALLAGQSTSAAHSHHDEANGGDETCELCLQGAKLDSFQPVVAFAHVVPGLQVTRVRPRPTTVQLLSVRHQNPRGPPRT